MYEAIIFDAYGTLIDTEKGSLEAIEAMLEKNNCTVDPKEVYEKLRRYHQHHMESIDGFLTEEEIFIKDLKKVYDDLSIDGDPEEDLSLILSTVGVRDAFPETLEVLNRLKHDYEIYIGSNTDTDPLISDLQQNGIDVDGWFTSEELRVYKPNKEFYEKILEEIGKDRDEVIFVGDSQVEDILGPHYLGIDTVWINRKDKRLRKDIPEPDYEIGGLRELYSILGCSFI